MLGHLGLNVPDLDTARHYYGRIMDLLGFELFLDHADEFAYRPAGARPGTYLFFYPSGPPGPPGPPGPQDPAGYHHTATGLQHLAFMVRTRSEVVAVRDRAVSLGSTIVYEPQVFPRYPQPYFATFWHDPFGFMLEAVCHHDRA